MVRLLLHPDTGSALHDRQPTGMPAVTLRAASSDVDEHCANLGRWQLVYDQISAGPFRGSFTLLSLSRIEVFREVTSQQVRQCGRLGSDSFSIGLPWRMDGDVSCNGTSATPNTIFASFDADVDLCTPKSFDLRGVIVSASLIEDLLATINVTLPHDVRRSFLSIPASDAVVTRFRHLLGTIQTGIGGQPQAFPRSDVTRAIEDALLLEIADLLQGARPASIERSAAARKRTVDRACEIMLAQTDSPLSILDLCKAVGASRRKLNYSFQDVLGCSPISYWRAIRLNRVRRELKRCDDPALGVYDIASAHGFWHFSQFSLDYKRHFAELPSETLRRSRAVARPPASLTRCA